jgi:hypothetical protein
MGKVSAQLACPLFRHRLCLPCKCVCASGANGKLGHGDTKRRIIPAKVGET